MIRVRHPVRQIKKIVISVRLNFQSGRDILYGISRYARQHCSWQFHIINDPAGPMADELRHPEAYGIDGIVADSVANAACWPDLARSKVPLVMIGERPRSVPRPNMAFVRNDDQDVGRLGAKFLLSLGRFSEFGFVTSVDEDYCVRPRREGFCLQLGDGGRNPQIYRMPRDSAAEASPEAIAGLARWLRSLPKPSAVMAIHDQMATAVVQAAQTAKIDIPSQIALISVDNDELLCESSSPQLTSIAVDHIHEGELIAKALHDLLRDGTRHREDICLTNTRKIIIERQSTKPLAPGTALVKRAQAFIFREATHGIRASDVADFLHVSRRLADLRFRQFAGKTILEAITERRLAQLKSALSNSDAPIARCLVQCGFHNLGHAKTLFKARFGQTMSEFRKSSLKH